MFLLVGNEETETSRKHFTMAYEYLMNRTGYKDEQIINPLHLMQIFSEAEYMNNRLKIELCIVDISDGVYVLKSTASDVIARFVHDYAYASGKRMMYSKKF